jgi:HEAT repeat protein
MAKARSLESKLARLRAIRKEPISPPLRDELRGILGDASNLAVAEAAEIAGEQRLLDLAPTLVAAFERFLDNPEKKDKLCRAKIAIVEALNKLEFADESFYLRGVHYVQREPAWSGPNDTAAPVRVASAFGLLRLRQRGVLAVLVDLLADSEKAARVGAAQALAASGTEAAGLLLRLKARLGDAEPEVIAECFGGIVELLPADGVAFVAEFLKGAPEPIQEAALLALGSSRRPEAFAVLQSFADKRPGGLQEVALVALALLRLPAATDHLLRLVADGAPLVAALALGALAVHRYDARVRERAAAAVAKNGAATLRTLFDQRFHAND